MIEVIDLLITGICVIGITVALGRLYFAVKEYRSSVANEKTSRACAGVK